MKKIFLFACFFILCCTQLVLAQNKKPKLFVGIIVDQMRIDYLYRFNEKFTDSGFNKLINQGFFGKNTHYNYIPTYTGPGHASVFSGSTPEVHGIIANDWYVRNLGSTMNCVDDSLVYAVGIKEKGIKSYSPINLLASNFADELRVGSQGKSKVVGVSIKNRGAILPSGHYPNGAYWFHDNTGKFITSTYYTDELPKWVKDFNKLELSKKFMSGNWETEYPIATYTESGPDDSPYEANFAGKHVFPYNLKALRKKNKSFKGLRITPFGNTIVKEMAKAAIQGESLGMDKNPDLITISFSSTDYVGHRFGPDSKEIQDTYIKLDKDIADLVDYLNQTVGEGEYVLFLTADHAVAQVPQFLIDKNIPAGYIEKKPVTSIVSTALNNKYGEEDWILSVSNDQIFLNKELIANKGINYEEFSDDVVSNLLEFKGIKNVLKSSTLNANDFVSGIKGRLQNGFNVKRSGDLLLIYEPGWFVKSYGKAGTTHGSGYNYDTHVPLILYGKGIPSGYTSFERLSITDIIPSLCIKYDINLPNGANGTPIKELFKNN